MWNPPSREDLLVAPYHSRIIGEDARPEAYEHDASQMPRNRSGVVSLDALGDGVRAHHVIGRSLARGRPEATPCEDALVVIRWDDRRRRFYVLTSYPED